MSRWVSMLTVTIIDIHTLMSRWVSMQTVTIIHIHTLMSRWVSMLTVTIIDIHTLMSRWVSMLTVTIIDIHTLMSRWVSMLTATIIHIHTLMSRWVSMLTVTIIDIHTLMRIHWRPQKYDQEIFIMLFSCFWRKGCQVRQSGNITRSHQDSNLEILACFSLEHVFFLFFFFFLRNISLRDFVILFVVYSVFPYRISPPPALCGGVLDRLETPLCGNAIVPVPAEVRRRRHGHHFFALQVSLGVVGCSLFMHLWADLLAYVLVCMLALPTVVLFLKHHSRTLPPPLQYTTHPSKEPMPPF